MLQGHSLSAMVWLWGISTVAEFRGQCDRAPDQKSGGLSSSPDSATDSLGDLRQGPSLQSLVPSLHPEAPHSSDVL